MIFILQWTVFLLYAIAAIIYWKEFISPKKSKWISGSFALIIVFHLAYIILFIIDKGRIPIANVSEAIGTFVWLTAILYFFVENHLKERSQGALILSVFVILLLISNITYNGAQHMNPILYDVLFEIHVFAILLGYGGFALSFIASLLQILLARELKKKELGFFFRRLPSLVYFERISDYAVSTGLIFAAIGFVLGIYNAAQVWKDSSVFDPKILSFLVILLVYLFYFIGRKTGKIRGQMASILSLVGFGLILFSFLIISTLIPGSHQFG